VRFLKPFKTILLVYVVGSLGIASDIAQLTNLNLLDFLKKHSPQSYYILIIATLLLYLALLILDFIRNKPTQQSPGPERNAGQFIRTRNVKNSTIIQIRKDKED